MKKITYLLFIGIILLSSFANYQTIVKNINDAFVDKIISVAEKYYQITSKCNKDSEEMHSWITDAGVRSKYFCLKSEFNLEILKKLTGEAVFTKGPHGSDINYTSVTEFGYYNPKFLTIIENTLTELAKNEKFKQTAQKIYDKEFKNTVRMYYLAYNYLISDTKLKKTIKKEYLKKIANSVEGQDYENDPSYYLQEQFRTFAEDNEKLGYDVYEGFSSPGFWIRRSIDGTDSQFFKIITQTLNLFDKDFVK